MSILIKKYQRPSSPITRQNRWETERNDATSVQRREPIMPQKLTLLQQSQNAQGNITQGNLKTSNKSNEEMVAKAQEKAKKGRVSTQQGEDVSLADVTKAGGLGYFFPMLGQALAIHDGYETLFGENGVRKTYDEASKGNFGKAALSGAGDLISLAGARYALTPGQNIRNSFYDNVTPFGYADSQNNPLTTRPKLREIADGVIDAATGGRYYNIDQVPKWKQRIYTKWSTQGGSDKKINGIPAEASVEFRDAAWRKAMRVPERENMRIYKPNEDGTYSYDMGVVNRYRTLAGGEPYDGLVIQTHPSESLTRFTAGDNITGNGGYVGATVNPDMSVTFTDKWDLQPFKDSNRSLIKWFNKVPKLKNMEAVKAVGGDPFILKHTIEDPIILYR